MRKKTRILSLLLAVICLVGVIAAPVMASPLYEKQVTSDSTEESSEESKEGTKIIVQEDSGDETPEEPAEKSEPEQTESEKSEEEKADDKPKSLDEMTDEEIMEAGEALLKAAIEKANKEAAYDRDITFTGEDAKLYERYQEVKSALAKKPKKRMFLMAASNEAEIQRIYALNYGDLLYYVKAYTQAQGTVHAIGNHVHYDKNTNNAVYCANVNRHFVNATIYEVAGQWKSSEMYSALSYVFDNGVRKLNGLAKSKYTTGNSSRDWYATQMVVWGILHKYGIKDAMGGDAGIDMNTAAPVAGYENVYNMMKKLYNDALYFASKQADGNTVDPYYVMENPDYKLILQGKTDVPFFITSAEAPAYTLDVKGGSTANDATVQLYKKNYKDNQQWQLEKSDEAGYYYFRNINSGKYLEVEGDGGANGDDIQQHTKNGSDGQKWKILAEADGTVQFAPKVAPGKRIDVKSGVFVNGTNVQLYSANNSKAQKFRCEPADVRVKNVSDDGRYLYTDWIDVSADGDLESRKFSLVGAPNGSTIEYEKSGDPMSRVRIRVPISAIPAGGQCDFQIRVDATFNKPTISYLAINDATTQELLVAGNSTQMEVSDRLAVYTLPIYGGVKVQKRDADTKGTVPQGQATLKGTQFQIINKSGYTILSREKEYKDGAVVMTITTDEKGYAATGEKDLQVGTYLIKEVGAPTGYLGEGVTEVTFEITAREEGTLVDMTGADKAIRNNVIRGGVKIKKQDSVRKNDLPQGDALLSAAEYQITNQSANPVIVGGKTYAKGQVVLTIKTDAKGIAQSGTKDLPYGDYEVKESKASEGYHLNKDWKKSFQIRENGKVVDLTGNPCDEPVIRGGVKIQKTDADLKKAQAQGDATLEGAVFAITNKSKEAVVVDGKQYAVGAVVKTISTNKDGIAQTAANTLPYGTYEIAEKDPSTGYLLNNAWKQTFQIREEGKIVDLTGKPCEEPVIRGGVKIKKQDNDYKDEVAQGDATLSAAEFTITNKSKASVVVNDKEYQPGEDVLTISTNEEGFAETAKNALPYGTYEIRETKPSEGYLLNEEWKVTFMIRENEKVVDLTGEPCDEKVIRGGVAIEKRDKELDKNEALGGAWLSGIEFTITNASNLRVWVDEKSFEPDEIITTIVTDEEGHASLPEECLPYGTYTIQETATNESYLLTDGEPRTFEIREDKEIVTVNTEGEDLNFRNQVVRNDFHLNKIADDSNARMGQVAFKLEMVKTGEMHVIVTDRNGVYNSQSREYKHSQDTNANDFVLEKYAGEDDVIPTAELNYKAGLWFGLGQKESQAEVNDALGALPYGEYRLTELRCEGNEGYKLLEITFYVEKDFTNGAIIDLGTMTDDEEPKPEIQTTALAKDTGTHETKAANKTKIIDTVSYKNLKPGKECTMHGKLMLVSEDGEKAEEILYNGNPVTAEKTFTPDKPDGTVEMEFTFDSSALGGRKTVVFEELRKGEIVVAAHADPKDEGQTVTIIDIGTKAKAKDTGTQETVASKETTIVDIVSYKGLAQKKKYTVKGILMDKATKKELLINGKTVTAEKTFKPEAADGTVEMEFTFDSSALAGKEVVVFEDLYREDVKIATHADITDEGQTVKIKEPEPTPTPEPTPEPEKPTITPTPVNPTTPSNPLTPSTPSTGKGTTTISAQPVKTGDNSRILLYLILMIAAGGAGVIAAKFRNRK